MSEVELYERIEDYLKGRLAAAEYSAFEQQMEADPKLAAEVALHKELMEATEEDVWDFRRQMEAIPVDYQTPVVNLGRQVQMRRLLAVAATILLLIVAGVLYLTRIANVNEVPPLVQDDPKTEGTFPNEKAEEDLQIADTEKTPPPAEKEVPPPVEHSMEPQLGEPSQYLALAEAFYDPYEASGLRSGDEAPSEENALALAQEAYGNKEYDRAISLLARPPEEERVEWLKLRAHAYFQSKQFDLAATDFEELTDISLFYKSDAEWNLLLCYSAQLPRTEKEFNELLKKVVALGHPFSSRAKELQEELNRPE